MANMTVDTYALARAAQALRRAGDEYAANAAQLSGGFGIVASAAGDGVVLAAALDASERWGRSVARCAAGLSALGAGLDRAAGAYESVEGATCGRFDACLEGIPRP